MLHFHEKTKRGLSCSTFGLCCTITDHARSWSSGMYFTHFARAETCQMGHSCHLWVSCMRHSLARREGTMAETIGLSLPLVQVSCAPGHWWPIKTRRVSNVETLHKLRIKTNAANCMQADIAIVLSTHFGHVEVWLVPGGLFRLFYVLLVFLIWKRWRFHTIMLVRMRMRCSSAEFWKSVCM